MDPRGRPLPYGRAGLLVLALLAGVPAPEAGAEDVAAVEASVRAAYLYQFTRFVEWPAAAQTDPIQVCVVGRDPFGPVLDRAVADRRVGGRRLAVRRLPDPARAAECHLAFLSAGHEPPPSQIVSRLSRRPVLLVSDEVHFASRGGMIGFTRDADRVRFEVNPQAAEAAGLRISSRLLGLARVVSTGSPAQ
jgi:hypothetical protein